MTILLSSRLCTRCRPFVTSLHVSPATTFRVTSHATSTRITMETRVISQQVRFLSTRNTDRGSILDSNVFRKTLSTGFAKRSRAPTQIVLAACFSAASVASFYKRYSWYNLPTALVGLLFVCLIQLKRTRNREADKQRALSSEPDVEVGDYGAYVYQLFPLRGGSRVVGFVGEKHLPKPILQNILKLYCWYFNVNLLEAERETLDSYRSLSEFFQRELKPHAREIHSQSELVLPCDGRVLHYGKCENGYVEQVKGVRYRVERFLGSLPKLRDPQNNELFYCVLYLAPGDYHLFHSPCSWSVDKVIHFPGTLMSVNPSVCKRVSNILTLNERVLLSGTWEHGFFSYSAVGATNVGSIRINFLKDRIKTNKGFLSFNKDTEIVVDPGKELSKGEMLGGFNFGSTVVLMFEAPNTFEFNLEPEQIIRMGRPLGRFPSKSDDIKQDDVANINKKEE